VGPRAGLHDVKERKFLIVPGLKLRPLCRPARSQSLFFYFLFEYWGVRVHTGSTRHCGHSWPIVPAPGDCEDGEVGGMNGFGRENRSTVRKPAPTPLYPPQITLARPGREPGPPRWEASDPVTRFALLFQNIHPVLEGKSLHVKAYLDPNSACNTQSLFSFEARLNALKNGISNSIRNQMFVSWNRFLPTSHKSEASIYVYYLFETLFSLLTSLLLPDCSSLRVRPHHSTCLLM
jgi:hypothetical protein